MLVVNLPDKKLLRIITASLLYSIIMSIMSYYSSESYQWQKALLSAMSGILFFLFFYKFRK